MAHAAQLSSSPLASIPARPASDSSLRRAGRAFWAVLEQVGQRRAAVQLEQLARSVEAERPELARQFRDAARSALVG